LRVHRKQIMVKTCVHFGSVSRVPPDLSKRWHDFDAITQCDGKTEEEPLCSRCVWIMPARWGLMRNCTLQATCKCGGLF
jgi:hypothetical protein